MKRTIAVVTMAAVTMAAVLALSGCVTTLWVKPGATESDFNHDNYDCLKDSEMIPATYGGRLGDMVRRDNLRQSCMESKGWTIK